MTDSYLYAIIPLLPLAASMVVLQSNPYQALILRGILGAVAALVYGVLGAADVALTEALVGTMLAIMLYAVAVRSSLVMRLGILDNGADTPTSSMASLQEKGNAALGSLLQDFQTILGRHYMRIELVPYPNPQALQKALLEKEIHATCMHWADGGHQNQASTPWKNEPPLYQTMVRIQRLYDILKAELSSPMTSLIYVSLSVPSISSDLPAAEDQAVFGEKKL